MAGCGLYYLFESRFAPQGPLWGSVIGGFLLTAGWGLIRNALIARGQAVLISDSLAGAIPRPGRPYAAICRAIATQFPLLSPFRHRPCVLYSYELSETKTVHYRGLYKDTRPFEWTTVAGYRREDIATVVAEGRTKGGSFERYVITVRKVDGKWKLRRDHFDDRFEFQFGPEVP